MKRFFLAAVLTPLLFCGESYAISNIFGIKVTDLTTNQNAERSFSSITDVLNSVDSGSLGNLLPAYMENHAAIANVNIRGLPITLSFPENSNALNLKIPSTGLDLTFQGVTRDASQDQLLDWFKGNGQAELTKLFQATAANTGNDPIAGNPNSLQGLAVANDFSTALSTSKATSAFRGLAISSLNQDGLNSRTTILPLAHTFRPGFLPDFGFTVKLPLSFTDVDGAKVFGAGLGLAVSYSIMENWTLTPAFQWAVGSSLDLGSATQMASGSLTSLYVFTVGGKAKSKSKADSYAFNLDNRRAKAKSKAVYKAEYKAKVRAQYKRLLKTKLTARRNAKLLSDYKTRLRAKYNKKIKAENELLKQTSVLGHRPKLAALESSSDSSIRGLSSKREEEEGIQITIGNMIGRYETIPLNIGGFFIDPDISNTVFRNAVLAHVPTGFLINGSFVQLSITDTRYTGSDLFINQYNEFGFAVGLDEFLVFDLPALGFTYLTSSKTSGFKVNLGLSF